MFFRIGWDAVNPDASPTARALLALELVQGIPGLTADRLADKLGVSEQLAAIPTSDRIVRCPELQEAARVVGQRPARGE